MAFNVGDKVTFLTDIHPIAKGSTGVVVATNVLGFGYRVKVDDNFTPSITQEEQPEVWEDFDGTSPVFEREIALLDRTQDSIEEALALAAKEESKLDVAIEYVGNLMVAYDAMRLMNADAGNEFGEMVYQLCRDDVHGLFHLLVDYRTEQFGEEDEEDMHDHSH